MTYVKLFNSDFFIHTLIANLQDSSTKQGLMSIKYVSNLPHNSLMASYDLYLMIWDVI